MSLPARGHQFPPSEWVTNEIVYTEDRATDPLTPDRFSELRNRGFVVKDQSALQILSTSSPVASRLVC